MNKKILIFLAFILLLTAPVFAGVDFDGVDDLIDTTKINMAGWSAFTVTAWVYWADTGSAEHSVFSNWDSNSEAGILFRLEPSGNRIEGFLSEVSNNQVGGTFTSTSVTANTWTFIALRNDGSNLEAFVNSTKDTTQFAVSANMDADNSNNNAEIGNTPHGGDELDGMITEVALWDVALSDNELSILASAKVKRLPLQMQVANLQGYWPLDDESDATSGDGDTFLDLSTNGYNGTGDNGGNNTGLTCKAEEVLTY